MHILKNRIVSSYGDRITNSNDLTGEGPSTAFFYLLAPLLRGVLDPDPRILDKGAILRRRALHPFLSTLGKSFLKNPQVFEDRSELTGRQCDPVSLPKEPVIFAANHAFKDDVLASILACRRHAYILFGSLPQFYNTVDGLTSWLNGVVMVNRKNKESKRSAVSKAVKVLRTGSDMLIFPEGVWNKSQNALILDLWPGIYRIARETGAKIVPVVHYIRDYTIPGDQNPIHTVVDNPFRIDDLPERAALEQLRDIMATWYYLMMERYGASCREEALGDAGNLQKAWEQELADRVKAAGRYDREIELYADYRPKWKTSPLDVWKEIAGIEHITPENAGHVAYACLRMLVETENDFQRRF